MILYIFDKDNTICRSKLGKPYIESVEDQELFPDVLPIIKKLKQQGAKIAIATNQGAVAEGLISLNDARRITEHAVGLIGGDAYRFCPYHPKGKLKQFSKDSNCRKPNPGMLSELIEEFNEKPEDVVMVGDMGTDKQAADNAGCEFEWANEFFNRGITLKEFLTRLSK